MCQIIGCPPISTIGLGIISVSSLSLVPKPPARITTFILIPPVITKIYACILYYL
ncbi:hypothetical protein ES705_03055 [subsurface metagenome]